MEQNKWGILYCPKGNASKQRQKIQAVLDQRGVEYDWVQSESTDSVERLMKMLISNGYKTIVVVGGDSALNDAVNCLMQQDGEVRDSIALGVIPNGLMNDFARYWDFKEGNLEQTIDWLKKRRVRKVDLGCLHYQDKEGQQRQRYFLNCVNIGLIADVMNLRRQTRSLLGSHTLSFIVSIFLMIFHRMDYKMRIRINTDTVDRKVMTMCVGSGPGYGQTPNAVPYSGLLDVSLVYHTEMLQVFAGLWLLLTGRFLNHRSVHPYRTREVWVDEAKHALVGVDGRLIGRPEGSYHITIESEVINFLIPE
jgi:diacylglycerol kinase family enzyme